MPFFECNPKLNMCIRSRKTVKDLFYGFFAFVFRKAKNQNSLSGYYGDRGEKISSKSDMVKKYVHLTTHKNKQYPVPYSF